MMADLISRAAAIDHMKSMAGCATCDNYNGVRCRACSWDDAVNIVDELPAVDALPMEWLRSQLKNNPNDIESAYDDICINELIDRWQKEQEART